MLIDGFIFLSNLRCIRMKSSWCPKFAVVVIGRKLFFDMSCARSFSIPIPFKLKLQFQANIEQTSHVFGKILQTCKDVCHGFFAPNQNQKTSHTGMAMAWKFFTVNTLLNWGRRRALYCYIKRDREGDLLVWLVVLQAPIGKDVTSPCMKATILEFCQFHASPAVHEGVLPC